jgi:signal transduction histidine kinase
VKYIRVLLIEDNPGDARLIREMLVEADRFQFDLVFAERLSVGRDYLLKEKVDLILLDLGLPDSHGLNTLAGVRATTPRLPVVVLTGLADHETGAAAVTQGAQDYLVKGRVDSELLARTITYAIERQQAEIQRFELAVQREKIKLLADFVEIISHEVRTPLSLILLQTEGLKRSIELDERGTKRIYSIAEQTRYIEYLVDTMLMMVRLDSGITSNPEPVDLNRLVREAEQGLTSQVEEKALTVTLDLDDNIPVLEGDCDYLGLAVTHLLDNAVNFTPDRGSIIIKTSIIEKQVVVEIMDTGIGISDSDLPFIFDRFYRADKARTSRKVGLGLSIAQRIIEAHSGRIEVESELGQGSTFRVFLPIGEP